MSPGPSRVPASSGFDRGEKLSLVLLFGAIGAVTVLGFVGLLLAAQRYDSPATGDRPAILLVTLGILVYTFGLKHGVDADHIAAIDNTTRKLLQEGKRPLTVGTWFSLGHSTIVVGLIVALAAATGYVTRALPVLQSAGPVIGAAVSGAFLWLIGIVNVVIVLEIWRIFRGMREGRGDEQALEAQLSQRGFMSRYFGRFFRMVETPRQIYPIGLLFGLGFDTATEVALIAISVGVVTLIPLYVVLLLPLLFLCGMILVDTADGVAMRYAYGWAFARPIRKVYYNLTVTVMSVLVAFAIGGFEFLQVLSESLGLTGPFWSAVGRLDLTLLGFLIVGLLLATWAVSVAYYRVKRIDEIGPNEAPTPAPVVEG